VVPLSFVGQKFSPVSFKEETHLKIVALKRNEKILYSSSQPVEDADREDLYFEPYDILVLIGDIRDIRKFLKS
jgi:K+/H+ antiporter YhaU regulatory subunit KhtT